MKNQFKPEMYAIDFGTSNSLLCGANSDGVTAPIPLDPDALDPSILRSVLFFPNSKTCYYGVKAIREYLENQGEGRLIRSIKKHLPIRSFTGTFIEDRPVYLEDLISFFLLEMKKRADAYFGCEVDSVVLGRPAQFSQEEADDRFAQYRLEKAAQKAGFKKISFYAEPLAAAYEFRRQIKEEKLVLVGDFGGGTSDFTVIRLKPDRDLALDVLSVGGISIAGDLLDGEVMRKILSPYFGLNLKYRVPLSSNILTIPHSLFENICSPADISVLRKSDTFQTFQNMRSWALKDDDKRKLDRLFCLVEDQLGFAFFEEIERVKKKLSTANLEEFIFDVPGVEVRHLIARDQFEFAINDRINAILKSLDETLSQAQVTAPEIDIVFCTGGTAKVRTIQAALSQRFGAHKIQEHNHFHSVVEGLGERARALLRY